MIATRDAYQRPSSVPPHLGSLDEPWLLFEDRNQFDALSCATIASWKSCPIIRAPHVLSKTPPPQATCSTTKRRKRRTIDSHVLSVPVTDFELSVRSRNCLPKDGRPTLGDLCRTTEQEAPHQQKLRRNIAGRNTRHALSKELELGQFAYEKSPAEPTYDSSNVARRTARARSAHLPIEPVRAARGSAWFASRAWSRSANCLHKTGDDLLECRTSVSPASTKFAKIDRTRHETTQRIK